MTLHPATRALIDRYDAVRADCDRALAAGLSDPAAVARAAPVLAAEARLLDARRWDDWLAILAPEAVLWVPSHPADHPGRDQALTFDDRRRMAERARHMEDPQAWGTSGPWPMTTRLIGPVEAWGDPTGVLATCALTVAHVRRGPRLMLAGRQVLRLAPDGRIAMKALLFPDLAHATPALGWLM
jgi:benzoate/toluate 1,2-dioxygenase beta subunit